MHNRFLNTIERQWLLSVLLVVLCVRALVPAGFMPSADKPFSFQICPDGFPTQLLHSAQTAHAAHHHHDGAQSIADDQQPSPHQHSPRAEHCVFAAAAGIGPNPQVALLLTPLEHQAAPQLDPEIALPELTRHRVQQPRAPPAFS